MNEIKPWGYVREDVLLVSHKNGTSGYTVPVYTADALTAAREEGRREGLEQAAQLLEEDGDGYGADAIRFLKRKTR